jgi:hypothetical protein
MAFAQPLQFAEHTIATDLKGGYQVAVADLNRDGRAGHHRPRAGWPRSGLV